MTEGPSIHANCVVVGEAGVLALGPSGSGKSAFSAALIEHAAAKGRFARLVADDRVRLVARNGRLLATAPAGIAGLIERRGLGIQRVPFVVNVVVRLVVELVPSIKRMPEDMDRACELEGLRLPRIAVAQGAPDGPALALATLDTLSRTRDCVSSVLAFGRQVGSITAAMAAPSISRSGGARAAQSGPRSERNEFCAETQ
ncbi:hypothetical protein [Methylopila sp. M107]|uniref:HPr kinase/phosphorylase n=1 Tax=Methylopila sp. M107 TaxID=1101190 RepID=UPI000374709C|nr:hypothetical protein [Methylopila sp. M107]